MTDTLLAARGLTASYEHTQVLWGVDLEVRPSEVVGIIGPNGAGKTTLLKAIAGIEVRSSGRLELQGRDVAGLPCHERVPLGISMVAQSRELFPTLTVSENLDVAAYRYRRDSERVARNLDAVMEMFPRLAERRRQAAGSLSGGEQQMLAVGRAIMCEPRLLLMDEPSTGLSPSLVALVMERMNLLRQTGVTVVVVEQAVETLVSVVDRLLLMANGRISREWAAADIDVHAVREAYLGHRVDGDPDSAID